LTTTTSGHKFETQSGLFYEIMRFNRVIVDPFIRSAIDCGVTVNFPAAHSPLEFMLLAGGQDEPSSDRWG
jgi:hypothetical protein